MKEKKQKKKSFNERQEDTKRKVYEERRDRTHKQRQKKKRTVLGDNVYFLVAVAKIW